MCESGIGKFLDSIPPAPPLAEKKEKKDLPIKNIVRFQV